MNTKERQEIDERSIEETLKKFEEEHGLPFIKVTSNGTEEPEKDKNKEVKARNNRKKIIQELNALLHQVKNNNDHSFWLELTTKSGVILTIRGAEELKTLFDTQLIQELIKQKAEEKSKSYLTSWTFVGAILAVLMAILGYSSLSDIKKGIDEHAKTLKEQMTTDAKTAVQDMKKQVSDETQKFNVLSIAINEKMGDLDKKTQGIEGKTQQVSKDADTVTGLVNTATSQTNQLAQNLSNSEKQLAEARQLMMGTTNAISSLQPVISNISTSLPTAGHLTALNQYTQQLQTQSASILTTVAGLENRLQQNIQKSEVLFKQISVLNSVQAELLKAKVLEAFMLQSKHRADTTIKLPDVDEYSQTNNLQYYEVSFEVPGDIDDNFDMKLTTTKPDFTKAYDKTYSKLVIGKTEDILIGKTTYRFKVEFINHGAGRDFAFILVKPK